jgi:selenocysteine-specific elongation factor
MHVIGTAGHVDHGKSTLVERLTGIDPDRFAEEKRRGLTIDLGFAWLQLPSGREIGIVDVPGHERFIKNMLAGAGGVSVCLFVVAANEGWKPQSAEHLAILDILGVSHGVVALTKSDTVEPADIERVTAEVRAHLGGTSLSGAPIVPVSAVTGAGVDELLQELDAAVEGAPDLPDVGRPRLWVDRVFTIAGAGTIVTGTLNGGELSNGQEVEIWSGRGSRRARIRKIQSHKKEVETIGPGNRVALNLVGLEKQGAERGDVVVLPDMWKPTDQIDVVVRVLPAEMTGRKHELKERGSYLIYVGSAETPVRFRLLEGSALASGETAVAQMHLRDPLLLARGDRFVLRDAGRILTFGGGIVADPLPDRAHRSDAERIALVKRLVTANAESALRDLLNAEGRIDLREALLRSGAGEPVGTPVGSDLYSDDGFAALSRRAVDAVERYHRANPLESGMAKEALRAELELGAPGFGDLLQRTDALIEEDARVRLAAHRVELNPEQERARAELMGQIEGSFSPPLAKDLTVDQDLIRSLLQAGELVRIGDFYLSGAQAAEARRLVRERIETDGPQTVAQIRDLLGTTRKYAVPLCEWLDSTGATRRQGDIRALGPRP